MNRLSKAKIVPLIPSLLRPLALGLTASVLTLTCFTVAHAERADRDKPMNIEADAGRYEDQKQLTTFTGRVVVTKGSIVMRGSRLEVRQDANGNQSGTMFAEPGQRAFFRQKREGLDEYIEGEGETIEYDGKADNVRFITRAELRRYRGSVLNDEITGAVIVYNNLTDVFSVDGQRRPSTNAAGDVPATGGRVRAVLSPKEPPATGPGAPAPAAPVSAPVLRPSNSLGGGAK